MTLSTLLSLLVGLVIPGVVALITRQALNAKAKALILLFLSTASGLISALVTTPPSGWSQWEHVLLNIVATYIAAAASLIATWLPTGASKAIHARTDRHFGIGKYDPTLDLDKAA